MPDHLRALVVILALATAVFAIAKASACAMASAAGDFERRRNLWFAITLTAFLAHDFWIYIVVTAILLVYALPREPNKLAMYFFLLFALPAIPGEISGLGIVNYIFIINYPRLLAMTVLLSAFLAVRKLPRAERFGQSYPDKLIAGYMVLNMLLMLKDVSFTEALRHALINVFLGIFLPYYVASRALKSLQEYRDALMAFVVASMVLGAIGAFEFARTWRLYASLQNALGVHWLEGVLLRDGVLRAAGSTDHPLVLGYVMAVATGFFLFLRVSVRNRIAWGLGMALLFVGLIAPVSRGPWLGAAVIIGVFIATGPSPGLAFAKLGLLGMICAPILLLSPAGDKIINLLPFVGTVDQENVSYRSLLLDVSLRVMMDNPYFGNAKYMESPAMQVLMQGQGIIDMVNTYLVIGLSNGLVGLSLFVGFFLVVTGNVYRAMKKITDRNDEQYLLGRVLLSTLLGILIMIFTVSPISVIPTIYWAVAGFGVAYARLPAQNKPAERASPAQAGPQVAARPA